MSGNSRVQVKGNVAIPARDGVSLSATLYFPDESRPITPCVLILTPYIADLHHERGMYFASQGLTVAIVDVRGRGNSGGTFEPHAHDGADGHDVVEWLARQPYSNGKVGMWGASYLGFTQWATAKEHPAHLATIAPAAAPCHGVDFPMRNNIFYPYLLRWLTYVSGRTSQARMFGDGAFWSAVYREWHESGRSFREVDTALGTRFPILQEWLDHPHPDAFWDGFNPTPEQYSRLQLPILTITGSYDDDQPGALAHYTEHLRHASPEARARHYLVIGPWDHARVSRPSAEFGGLRLGPAAVLDLMKLHAEWYRWTMEAGVRPAFLEKRVAYYVMGAEKWRYAQSLPEVTWRNDLWFLDSTVTTDDVFLSGSLSQAPGSGSPDSYTYDPRESGPEVDVEARIEPDSLVDQQLFLALRGKQLVYHSAPFDEDTEVSGFFRLTAWIAIDCPDTDLYVSVHEIDQDGGSIKLTTDAIRARYREGLRQPKLVHTREPLLYEFQRFTFISRRVSRGHRLRLVIAPMGRLIEATFAQRNFNAGGVVAEEGIKDARPVTVTLFHDPSRPSALHVPLGHPEPMDRRPG